MGANLFSINHRPNILIGNQREFVDFMRGAETVEKVDKGDAAFQTGGLGHQSHVMTFLYRAGCQLGESSMAHGGYIGMVAENRQTLRG